MRRNVYSWLVLFPILKTSISNKCYRLKIKIKITIYSFDFYDLRSEKCIEEKVYEILLVLMKPPLGCDDKHV